MYPASHSHIPLWNLELSGQIPIAPEISFMQNNNISELHREMHHHIAPYSTRSHAQEVTKSKESANILVKNWES